MAAANSNETALGPFERVLADVKKLWKWAAVTAAVPFLANLASLAPPWPSGLIYLTAIFELLLLIWSYHNLKGASKKTVSIVVNAGILILIFFVITYLYFHSNFVFDVRSSSVQGIRGYVCTDLASERYASSCPLLNTDQIADAEYDSELLWSKNSITQIRILLVGMWLLIFVVLTAVLGAFVVRQHDVAEKARN